MSADGAILPSVEGIRRSRELNRERASEASLGLVTTTTSDTAPRRSADDTTVEVHTNLARLQRMRQMVVASATLHDVQLRQGGFRYVPVMITLTYRDESQPETRHITEFQKRVREHMRRRGLMFPYVWVAELQERGVLHYHLITWLPPKFRLPKPDACGWWPHGHTRIEVARKAVGYIAKYASKLKSKYDLSGKTVPRGFRIHGTGGLEKDHRETRSFIGLPGWIRSRAQVAHRMRRCPGGGFRSLLTGEVFDSIWKVLRVVRQPIRGAVVSIGLKHEGVDLCIAF